VEFSQAGANRFMKVANECSNSSALTNLSQSKVFALLDLPQEQREEFIATTPVDEMTTRELQQAIKDKKELERLLESERNKPPRTIEKVVERKPADYDKLKDDLKAKEQSIAKLNDYTETLKKAYVSTKARVEDYEHIENRIQDLTRKETELLDKVRVITDLSTLQFEIEKLLKEKLAPVRYSKSLKRLDDPVARENLEAVLNSVASWLNEINSLLNFNYVGVEYESID
jgi:hypothetical protein